MPRSWIAAALAVLLAGGCSSAPDSAVSPVTAPVSDGAAAASAPVSTVAITGSTPVPGTTAAPSTVPASSPPPTPAEVTTAAVTTTTAAPANTALPAIVGAVHVVPLGAGVHFSYGHEHHDYPASDIFADCGSTVVAPTDATLLEVRPIDEWDRAVDNPATRGGKSISMLGSDGVRYYLAHLSAIDDGIEPGLVVTAGQELGEVGQTGRASACHLHFAISPPCPAKEWKVRRGVIWPWPYLDAWRDGTAKEPAPEVQQWAVDHPGACADAIAEPTAPDA